MSTTISPGATVRPAQAGDVAGVERLLTASSLPTGGVAGSIDSFVVAEAGGSLVGVAGLEVSRENALLRSVAVDPAWRSRGVGRALVTRVISDAEARNLRGLYLLTTTAERYFPSFGFEPVARDAVPPDIQETSEFRSVCPSSATAMCRPCGRS